MWGGEALTCNMHTKVLPPGCDVGSVHSEQYTMADTQYILLWQEGMQTTHFNHIVHFMDNCYGKRRSDNCQFFYTQNSSKRSQCIYVGMLAISGAPPVTHLSHIRPVLQLRDNTFSKGTL